MAPRPTKKSPGSTTPQPPPRPDLPVQARHPPPPGLPATAPRPTAVVGRVAELMGGKVTRLWGVARAPVHPPRPPGRGERRRPGPVGAMSDEALVEAIRKLLRDSPFHGEGHRKLWARLRFAGIRTSRRRVLRLMRAHGLLAPQRAGRPRGPKAHDGTITTERVDLMWGTDLTSVVTGEGQAAVFVAVDHCSAECVGIHASLDANRFEALEPLRQGVRRHFGGFAKDVARGLSVRHDHGSQYMARDFQKELRFLGIESSPAFVRAPEGNGCAERF